MKKVKLCVILACCATLLLSSCSNMLDSLEKAAETKESTKTEKAEETGNPENTQPLPQEPITPQPQIPEENQEPEEQQPEQQQPQEQQPEQQQPQEQEPEQQQPQEQQQPEQNPNENQKTITYTFNANGGKWTDNKTEITITGKTGDAVSLPENPVYTTTNYDYKFTGWNTTVPQTFGEENLSFQAQWKEEKILATIEYYLQNLEDDNYTKQTADTVQMKVPLMYKDSDIPDACSKHYRGFSEVSRKLKQNSNIEFYYDRMTINYIYNGSGFIWPDNGMGYKTASGKVGEELTIPVFPDRDNQTCIGWVLREDISDPSYFPTQLLGDDPIIYSQAQTFTIEADSETVTLYALWKTKSFSGKSLTFVGEGDVSIQSNGNTFTATPNYNCGTCSYEWYFNNVKQTSVANSCTIDTTGLQPGYYELFVKATNSDGVYYITNGQVVVEQ